MVLIYSTSWEYSSWKKDWKSICFDLLADSGIYSIDWHIARYMYYMYMVPVAPWNCTKMPIHALVSNSDKREAMRAPRGHLGHLLTPQNCCVCFCNILIIFAFTTTNLPGLQKYLYYTYSIFRNTFMLANACRIQREFVLSFRWTSQKKWACRRLQG